MTAFKLSWVLLKALIDSFWLDSLVKTLTKDDFKFLSQEFDSNILDLVNQKRFHPYEYLSALYVELWSKRKVM